MGKKKKRSGEMTEEELNSLIEEQKQNAPDWYKRSEKYQTNKGKESAPHSVKRRLGTSYKRKNHGNSF